MKAKKEFEDFVAIMARSDERVPRQVKSPAPRLLRTLEDYEIVLHIYRICTRLRG